MNPEDADLSAEESNRRLWDELTAIHLRAYPVQEFLDGRCSLRPVEVAEVGDVRGRALLHLQCHFGMDTLSWARRGARVTGVDFSAAAIDAARRLAEQAGLEARFLLSSVFDLPQKLDERFDIVYTGVGVLCWLRDIGAWGRVVARFLKPGGFFYIYESHPFIHTFDDELPEAERTSGGKSRLVPRYGYFHRKEPFVFPGGGPDYADPGQRVASPSHEWVWSLSDVVNALTGAGLGIDFLHEHPKMPFKFIPGMVEDEDGLWHLPEYAGMLPLAFSLKARR